MRKPCSKSPSRGMASGPITLARWFAWTPPSGIPSLSCLRSASTMSMEISNATRSVDSGSMEKVLNCGRVYFLVVSLQSAVEGSGEIRSRSHQARYLKSSYSLGIGGEQVVDAVIIIFMLLSGLLGRPRVESGAALIFLGLHVSLSLSYQSWSCHKSIFSTA